MPAKKTNKKPKRRRAREAATPSKILVLRTCDKDLKSYSGFQWPGAGPVEATDWDQDPAINCGKGLHGLAWGEGNGALLSSDLDAKWLVVEVNASDLVQSSGGDKVRFRRGNVIYCGDMCGAISRCVCGAENFARLNAIAKRESTSSGNGSKAASSGDGGIAAAIGNNGIVRAGPDGLLIACWWDLAAKRYHACIGEVGVGGIEADTDYRVVDGRLAKVTA